MDWFDRFEALSFDCYGTLIDWERGLGAELAPWAASKGLDVGVDELVAQVGALESGIEAAEPALLYPQVLERVLAEIATRCGVLATPEECRSFGSSVPRWPAFPDSPAALALLARRYRLIILSNIDRESFAASNRRLGVEFDLILTAQDIGSYKPDKRNFNALLEAVSDLGIAPGGLLHVAQSLFHDHVPAKAAGLPTVWIDRRHGQEGFGATPPPSIAVAPDRRYESMAAFARAATADG